MQHSNRPRTSVLYLAIVLAVGSLMISGCDDGGGFVLSLEPSYTPTDLGSEQALVGAWTTAEGDATLNFEQGERQEYRVVVKEKDEGRESSAEFEAHLVRLGTLWFIDFLPNGKTAGTEFYQMHLFRAHSIARIELSQDTLQMAFLDATWLQKKIDEKAVGISHQKIDGMLLLTGATEEVQDLLFLHGNDDEAFPDPIHLTRPEMQQ
jgi:hypothetical protein